MNTMPICDECGWRHSDEMPCATLGLLPNNKDQQIAELKAQLATAQADLESMKVECTILRASGQDEALVRAFVQGYRAKPWYGKPDSEVEQEARRLLAAGLLGKEQI